ncbi:MAG: hypothetical protein NTY19_39155 [Planctomycetota bacterium]|nr:hypothetical protein [Planctomycetota bacterium]
MYHDTQDEQVYRVLSRRLKDKFDIFGGRPDTIEDDWMESAEQLEATLDQYIELGKPFPAARPTRPTTRT